MAASAAAQDGGPVHACQGADILVGSRSIDSHVLQLQILHSTFIDTDKAQGFALRSKCEVGDDVVLAVELAGEGGLRRADRAQRRALHIDIAQQLKGAVRDVCHVGNAVGGP